MKSPKVNCRRAWSFAGNDIAGTKRFAVNFGEDPQKGTGQSGGIGLYSEQLWPGSAIEEQSSYRLHVQHADTLVQCGNNGSIRASGGAEQIRDGAWCCGG